TAPLGSGGCTLTLAWPSKLGLGLENSGGVTPGIALSSPGPEPPFFQSGSGGMLPGRAGGFSVPGIILRGASGALPGVPDIEPVGAVGSVRRSRFMPYGRTGVLTYVGELP